MERYGVSPLSPGRLEERRPTRSPSLHHTHFGLHSVSPCTLLNRKLESSFKNRVISSKNLAFLKKSEQVSFHYLEWGEERLL